MNFFERRKLQKYTKHFLHEAKLSKNMREDVADPKDLEALAVAQQTVHESWKGDPDPDDIEQKLENLSAAASKVYPPRPSPRVRENVEILAVAIIIAMGFRTYFLQPFKIPTGSMQPTLYGIHVDPEAKKTFFDKPPMRYAKFLMTGDRYVSIRARKDGIVRFYSNKKTRKEYIQTDSPGQKAPVLQRFYKGMNTYVKAGDHVSEGTLIAEGLIKSGDHIFVDKVRFNFFPPRRGQIVVFLTEQIEHSQIQKTDHYIKRLVGLPGEEISILPPHLLANGAEITEPYPFKRMLEDDKYSRLVRGKKEYGYTFAHAGSPGAKLRSQNDVLKLGDHEVLPFGDNTTQSLDGRYFGGVPLGSLVGPAFVIYWPFGERWGKVR